MVILKSRKKIDRKTEQLKMERATKAKEVKGGGGVKMWKKGKEEQENSKTGKKRDS